MEFEATKVSLLEELEKKIGYKFVNYEFLLTALTHSSYANDNSSKSHHIICNERLEFLGDSVLSLVTSEYLYEKFPNLPEGELSKIRASVVCEKALYRYSSKISLSKYLYLGRGEESNNGRKRESINADAFEAIIASIYLDSNFNMDSVRKFLLPILVQEITNIKIDPPFVDYKTVLQQIVQASEGDELKYVLVSETGPDHNKLFDVNALINDNVIGNGKAGSKREAEQLAAKKALEFFGVDGKERI